MEYMTNPFREMVFVFLDIRKVRVDKLFLAGPICSGYQIVDRLNAMVIREASVLGQRRSFPLQYYTRRLQELVINRLH
jgi:hypothetical protein